MNRAKLPLVIAITLLPMLTACPPPKPSDVGDDTGPAGDPVDNEEAGPTEPEAKPVEPVPVKKPTEPAAK
jgi:hypothetical protein